MHATTSGWVKTIVAHDGDNLKKGDVILVATSPSLDSEIAQTLSQIDGLTVRIRQSKEQTPERLETDRYSLQTLQDTLAEKQREKDELTFKAPFDGTLIAPELINLQDRYLDRGMEVCTVAAMNELLVRGDARSKRCSVGLRAWYGSAG